MECSTNDRIPLVLWTASRNRLKWTVHSPFIVSDFQQFQGCFYKSAGRDNNKYVDQYPWRCEEWKADIPMSSPGFVSKPWISRLPRRIFERTGSSKSFSLRKAWPLCRGSHCASSSSENNNHSNGYACIAVK